MVAHVVALRALREGEGRPSGTCWPDNSSVNGSSRASSVDRASLLGLVGKFLLERLIVDLCTVGNTEIAPEREDRSLSASMLPRIIGFDVPRLQEHVDSSTDEAIIALLDLAPGARWIELFLMKCEALATQLSLAQVRVEGSKIYFYGSISDSRALADAVMSIVHVLNDQLMREGNDAAGQEGRC